MRYLFFLLALIVTSSAISQEERIVRAQYFLKNKKYNEARGTIDSAIRHPLTKTDYVTWTTRAYIYYYLLKPYKMQLYSPLRDTVLRSLKVSNSLRPDSEFHVTNAKLLTTIAVGYFNIARSLLQDSVNPWRSEIAYSKFRKIIRQADPKYELYSKDVEYWNAMASVLVEQVTTKYNRNGEFDQKLYDYSQKVFRRVDSLAKLKSDSLQLRNSTNRINKLILETTFLNSQRDVVQSELTEREETLTREREFRMRDAAQRRKERSLLEQDKRQKELAIKRQKADMVRKEEELAAQKRTRNILLTGGALLSVLTGTVFYSLLRNRKQKKVITTQKQMIEEKQDEILDSINYAKRILRSMLASENLLKKNLGDYFIFFRPKDIVSGDFYWGAELPGGGFVFATADSTGHGVPGAIMSMLNISCLSDAVEGSSLTRPAEILNHARRSVIRHLANDGSPEGGKDGMDCTLIVLDSQKKHLRFAGANNSIWIVRRGELLEINGDRMPVGKHDRDHLPFSESEFGLQSGDMIYTFTDGMPDQFGGKSSKKYLYKRLKDFLVSISELPVHEQESKMYNEFSAWMGNNQQVDDVTIIGMRV